jgi:endonuclease/exonuclease/phosphatase (EEP) superfamily protein YafD
LNAECGNIAPWHCRPLEPRVSHSRKEKFARPLAFATGAVLLATSISFLGRWSWISDLLVNFRTHYMLLLGLSLAGALACRHWRIAGAAVAGLGLNAWPIHTAFLAPTSQSISNGRPVRVVSFNKHISNDNLQEVAAYLESLEADVAVLQEVSTASADRLPDLVLELPHRYMAARDGLLGIVILSRWPLSEPQPLARNELFVAARADVDLGDRKFRLYGAHLNWPLAPESARVRNAQLRALGLELAGCPHSCVAVGDFNVTPWSSHFRAVLQGRDVRDCAAGRGLLPTWSSDLPKALRIRIDHCLLAGATAVAEVRIGASVGSDHLATINDLLIGGP